METAATFVTKGEADEDQFHAAVGEASLPPEVMEFILLILKHYIPIAEALPVFSDEELSRLAMPLLFLAGEEDATTEAKQSAARLTSIRPEARIALEPDCGHLVPNAAEIFLPFLAEGV